MKAMSTVIQDKHESLDLHFRAIALILEQAGAGDRIDRLVLDYEPDRHGTFVLEWRRDD